MLPFITEMWFFHFLLTTCWRWLLLWMQWGAATWSWRSTSPSPPTWLATTPPGAATTPTQSSPATPLVSPSYIHQSIRACCTIVLMWLAYFYAGCHSAPWFSQGISIPHFYRFVAYCCIFHRCCFFFFFFICSWFPHSSPASSAVLQLKNFRR